MTRRGRKLWLALGCAWLVAGCAGPAPRSPAPASVATASPAAAATPVVVVQAVEPRAPTPAALAAPVRPLASASPVAATLPLSVLAGRSGAGLRVAIDLVLQEQVYLMTMATDAAISARLDELSGASDALDQNAVLFAELIGSVKGLAASQAVLDAWRGLNAALIDYAEGHQASAISDLDRLRPQIAAQLALDTFSQANADDLLRRRLQAQLALADRVVSRDAEQVAPQVRAAVATSDELGLALATAMAAHAPDQAPPPTQGADIDERLMLTRGLQERTYLTGAALDAAADGRAADLQGFTDASDRNAAELGNELGSVFGANVGDQLADRLRAETTALVSAASGGDRREAVTTIDRLRGEIDRLLAGANQLLPPGLVAQELRASDQPLLTAADAFQARDWSTAFVRLRESARQSQKPAETLAVSIIDRYPGRYLAVPTRPPG